MTSLEGSGEQPTAGFNLTSSWPLLALYRPLCSRCQSGVKEFRQTEPVPEYVAEAMSLCSLESTGTGARLQIIVWIWAWGSMADRAKP